MVADQVAVFEVSGNVDADRHVAGTQAAPQIADGGCVLGYFHHAARLHIRDERARYRGSRLVDHAGTETAHVEVDRVAEQQHLHHRDADDHAERQPVAAELADFLAGNGEDARHDYATACFDELSSSALKPVAATNTSSRLARTRSTLPATPCFSSSVRMLASGSLRWGSSSACSRLPSCATLFTYSCPSSARRAPRTSSASISITTA